MDNVASELVKSKFAQNFEKLWKKIAFVWTPNFGMFPPPPTAPPPLPSEFEFIVSYIVG